MRPSAMFGQGSTTIGNDLATLDILRNSFLWKYKWPLTTSQPQEQAPHLPPSVHFFLLAFSAALVVFPLTSLGVVALITPTATVCLMSLTVNLLQDLSKLAGNVGGVAIKHGRVAVGDLSGVVEHDHLGGEVRDTAGGLVLGVGGDVAPLDVLHGDVLDVEANVVAGDGLGQGLVVHLDGPHESDVEECVEGVLPDVREIVG